MQQRAIEGFQLSFQQKRLWALQQQSRAYHAQLAISIDGPLDAQRLQQALQILVSRHEILRTVFGRLAGMDLPIQVIEDDLPLAYREVDCSGLHLQDQEAEIEEVLRQEARQPFPLESGPIIRFALLVLSPDRHVLTASLPALCADNQSLSRLAHEIGHAYAATLDKGELPDEMVQYVDFSEWQTELFESDQASAGKQYWRKSRTTAPANWTSLPEDDGDGTHLFEPQVIEVAIDAALTARIDAVASEHHATAQSFLLACWQTLLYRMTGQQDTVVGHYCDGRRMQELNSTIGLLGKYLPLGCHFEDSFQFDEVLGMVSESLKTAYSRQEFFSWDDVKSLNGNTSENLFYPILFDYEEWPGERSFAGLRFSIRHQYVCTDRFKLRLCCNRLGDHHRIRLQYDPAIHSRDTVSRIAHHFLALVASAAASPQSLMSRLNLLTPAQRRQLLDDWNRTDADFDRRACVHDLFQQQALRSADKVAVKCLDRQLTYGELNRRANQLAHHLRSRGVGVESIVAIYLERSVDMLVAILGAMKAGAAYMPLDSGQAHQRLAFMLADAAVAAVVTQEDLRESLPAVNCEVVSLDGQGEEIASHSSDDLEVEVSGDNLAYVIYTSGSTGRPKGVMVQHRSVVNLLAALQRAVYAGQEGRLKVAVNAPLAFDASVKQIMQVANGHALDVIPEEVRRDTDELVRYVAENEVEVLDCTPSQLKLMLERGLGGEGGKLKKVLVGGEAIEAKLWKELGEGAVRYYNVYGPTECTVDATACEIDEKAANATIGSPISNVRVYILDKQQQLLPVGVTGELYISGEGLARGYINSAELTAERFLPDPYSDKAGGRMYRTGDRGKWREDGKIDYEGRADEQVKVRGHRIELGEIERVVEEHEGVREAAVVLKGDDEHKRLVAYVVLDRKHAATVDGRPRYELPNGMFIVHQNKNETDFLFEEIFEKQNYEKHGISVPESGCVFDVGANIGMFTMYVSRRSSSVQIYAFEPIRPIYETLRINAELYGSNVKLFHLGLSDSERTEEFSYYPKYSMMSGQSAYANPEDEVKVIKSFLRNEQQAGREGVETLLQQADELLAGRFEAEAHECRLKRLSEVIRDEAVERIDLLKIDVQRAELDVLRGIDDQDWAKVNQIVLEVHDKKGADTEGRVEQIAGMLESRGFHVVAEQDQLLTETDRYNLYAVRNGKEPVVYSTPRSTSVEMEQGPFTLNQLRSFLKERLPDYMMPSAFVVLDDMPLTRNGKIDRQALPAPELVQQEKNKIAAPTDQVEELLAGIWQQVLNVEPVGRFDNFFDLGGHSLLATQLVSRLREAFRFDIPLRTVFEAPTIAALAEKIRQAIRSGSGSEAPAILRASREAPLPLSFAQQRLWFLDQMEPGNPFYNVPLAVRVEGELNLAAFEKTLNEITRRHEVFRTTFSTIGGNPVQVIHPPRPLLISVIDLSALTATQKRAEGRRLADQEASQGFDLRQGPLLRVQVLLEGKGEQVVILTMHHIVSDAWSAGVLVREVAQLYGSYSQGEASGLEELELQYGDYAVWQRSWLEGEALEEELGYWRQQLGGAPEVLELPTDRPRPAVLTYKGATQPVILPDALAEQLRRLSRQEDVTLFMTLLAIFNVLLYRYTGQQDIVVGSPIEGRNRIEVEPLIGFFINTLALRTDLSGSPSFRELLGRIREVALGAYAHQDLPFEKLVEELNPERSLSHTPVFQVAFGLQSSQIERVDLPGLSLSFSGLSSGTAKFDIVMSLIEVGSSLEGSLHYNTDLFDESTITRFIGHYHKLLESVAANPDQAISALPMLTLAERQQLLLDFNETTADHPYRKCIHEVFNEQVRRAPSSTAVLCGDQSLTYAELDARANQLAHHLQSLGVGPDVLVGICLERSAELIVGLLGILKAGGAYLPLDPSYPLERLAYMLEDSGVSVLLTQEALVNDLPSHWGQVICIDSEWDVIAGMSDEQPMSDVTPENLAYVIYTSGSTGSPKGVMIQHAGLCNMAEAQARAFNEGPDGKVLQFASLSFDASIFEIVMSLRAGATLCLAGPDDLLPGTQFTRLLVDNAITNVTLPPSVVAALPRMELDSIRTMIVAGDACQPDLIEQWGKERNFFNAYGPTEATVWATVALCKDGSRRPHIGRPIANVQVYLLDENLEPVPINVASELHIGGAGLARGYLNRPDLTAEKFIPNPFSSEPGARLYKTGDLARYLADGNIDFLGRVDRQVKVRGFRIELGEIEAAIANYSPVEEVAVVAQRDATGDKQLVAYLVAKPDHKIIISELRAYLKNKLPDHLLPSAMVVLEKMPLTPNGKIDRRALPSWESTRPDTDETFVEPQTELERYLAKHWQRVLGVERVGARDNFFEIGGDSIKVAILVNRLQEELGEIIHVVALFDAPTIAEFAAHLSEHYPNAVARACGVQPGPASERTTVAQWEKVDSAKIAQMRSLVAVLSPREEVITESKNPRAVFVLSPPRSGSTLLRVMLAGHPRLFAPPELELLSFNTLLDRKAAFTGRDSFWLEGTIRALMEIKGCDAAQAKAIMEECEDNGMTTKQFYRLMQEWIGDRVLVDKSPAYAIDPVILNRAEAQFEDALYIHLLRNPYGMIRSFEEARIDQILSRYEHSYSVRELAELVWVISHQNALDFLQRIPESRQRRVSFEELVARPDSVAASLCEFIGIEFHPDMLEPYQEKRHRMTDGIHDVSKMLGDIKFHQHKGIDANVADRWKEYYTEDFLGEVTWEVAGALGYKRSESEPERAPKKETTFIPLVPRDGTQDLPLSFAQQRLWFLNQLEPESPVYNCPSAVRLKGQLSVEALERTLSEVVRRHEVLRTTFATVAGRPVQQIHPFSRALLPLVDLSHLPEPQREAEAMRLATVEAQAPFNLSRGPLLRMKLLRLGTDHHLMLFTMHHVVGDGWSMGVLVREVAILYEAFITGRPSPLEDLPVQYADYAHWQRCWLQGEVLESQLAYWKEQLRGSIPVLELPLDRPRPQVYSYQGATRSFELEQGLSESLKEFSRREGVTLFMTLMAAFQTLLHMYSGQDDLCVGTPIAGRNRSEIEALMGFFINTLVIRTDLSGDPTFRETLRRVREVTVAAFAHQDVPFEELVDELQPERSLNHTPFFQVVFSMHNTPREELHLPGLTLMSSGVEVGTAKFDLILAILDTEQGLKGSIEYNTDLFDESTIARMIGHIEMLLGAAVSDPDQHISDLPILAEQERNTLMAWNAASRSFPNRACIHSLFESQVERVPDAVAVISEDQSLTYSELNRRANRLAHYLQKLGVGPEVLVGLCVDRSIDMVIGILGILKAGGAYLPLDIAYPKKRLAFMLEDAQVPVILTQEELVEGLGQPDAQVVCLDTDWELIARESDDNPDGVAVADNIAYVIYTSGSTGTPKGVPVSHRNVTRLFDATQHWFNFNEGDVWTLFHSYAFDFSVWELWGALIYGGRLVVIPYWVSRSPETFYELLIKEGVTVLNQTPSAFRQLMRAEEEFNGEAKLNLRHIIFGGEALELQTLKPWFDRHGDERPQLINMYGITETTVHVTYRALKEADLIEASGSVIGSSIPDLQLYVLDKKLRPAPIGVPGEIHVGGAGLSRGYLNRPALTAERFVPNPFANSPGERLYRSGDLARYTQSGDIEYLGRIDQQIKIRGFRIELGEIESLLSSYPSVGEAVVITREDESGHKQLIGYVVARQNESVPFSELRAYLKERLPDYMVPSAFVMLDEMPLTPNGKLDRKALPAADALAQRPDAFRAARNHTEHTLTAIWQDVLGLPRIGIEDNFFELGGDSILSIQIVARANAAGLHLTPRQMFQHQTIAQLAQVAGANSLGERSGEQGQVIGEVALTPIQERFFRRGLQAESHYNQSVMLEVVGELDEPALRAAVAQLLIQHDALRMRFEKQAERWRQYNEGYAGAAPVITVDLREVAEAAQRRQLEAATSAVQQSLDIQAGALMRVALYELGEGGKRLQIVIHHLVVDGVSWRILLEDLQKGYEQAARGEQIELGAKTSSYQEWAEGLMAYGRSAEVARQAEYWEEEARKVVKRLKREGGGGNEVGSARSVVVRLEKEETRELLQEVVKAYGAQIDEVLLAGVAAAVGEWSGGERVRIEVEGHGREEVVEGMDVTRTVGWFTSIYPVVIEVVSDDILKSVKEQMRAVPDRGIGYGVLKYLSDDEGIKERLNAVEPEISFNYLGQLDQSFGEKSLFTPAKESGGTPRGIQEEREYLLNVSGMIINGRLQMSWTHSKNLHSRATVERLANTFIETLRSFIKQSRAADGAVHTSADFPKARLSSKELEKLISKINQADARTSK